MTGQPEVGSCTVLLLGAFVLAGCAQTVWFAAPASGALSQPLDFGRTWRGRRILGDHKTVRGFVVLPAACAAAFPMMAWAIGGANPVSAGLWPLSWAGYAALGAWSGAGFMLGELPNSFTKRQLDVAPGAVADGSAGFLQRAADRLDSPIGMLCALALVVSTPALLWLYVLTIGPFVHGLFSLLMFRAGIKPRAA